MDFFLFRTHFRAGTNGMLFHKQHFICFCVELPWRCNEENTSCIPDGVYELERCYSLEFGHHIRVKKVPERCGILFRCAIASGNDSSGAIVPTLRLEGVGKGSGSKEALHKVLMRMEAGRSEGELFFLTVESVHSGR
jgi:hypothetical protein